MGVWISLLRGINVGGHRLIKMERLRALYESLELKDVRTHLQSGNVVFRANARDPVRLRKLIEDGIEREFGFRSDVVLRTCAELKAVVTRNPFATRPALEPGTLGIHFLAAGPGREARALALAIRTDPEELRIEGSELYIYYPNGMGRPKLSLPLIEKTLKTLGTTRNWNTVRKLLEMAEELETGVTSKT
jgi:uncharacterized protein (DUF1697 family)